MYNNIIFYFIFYWQASKSERQKNSPTYKDLDFMEQHTEGIFLEADTYTALIKTMQRDCRVLESFKVGFNFFFVYGRFTVYSVCTRVIKGKLV